MHNLIDPEISTAPVNFVSGVPPNVSMAPVNLVVAKPCVDSGVPSCSTHHFDVDMLDGVDWMELWLFDCISGNGWLSDLILYENRDDWLHCDSLTSSEMPSEIPWRPDLASNCIHGNDEMYETRNEVNEDRLTLSEIENLTKLNDNRNNDND